MFMFMFFSFTDLNIVELFVFVYQGHMSCALQKHYIRDIAI